jgi:hypothetical protein
MVGEGARDRASEHMICMDQWMRRLVSTAIVVGTATASGGCIDGFIGSDVQVDFSNTTPLQVTPGGTPTATELPNNVHFTLYAVQQDKNGSGAITADHVFAVQTFEIHPIIDVSSPCFIDVGAHVPHPGLHVTPYAKRIGMDYGVPDVANPPADATENAKIEAATADEREVYVAALSGAAGPKAVTSVSTFNYGAIGTACVGDPGSDPTLIPPPTCFDDDSNAQRLQLCQAIWAANPTFYEGNDRVISEPLNGTEFGVVDGLNPVNESPIGGTEWFVTSELGGMDAYAFYWQYDDADGDGQPDYPAGTPASQKSPLGQIVFGGEPEMITQGVDHVHMVSPANPGIFADVAIFPNLDQDDNHF